MNSLYLSTTNAESFIKVIKQYSNTIKDTFLHIGGKLSELHNQGRDTVFEIKFCVLRNLYGLVNKDICINSLISSILDR